MEIQQKKPEQYHSFWKVAVKERGKMRVRYLPVTEGRRLHIDAFPNFSASGSVKGMKEKYYGKDALLVRCGSYIYCVWQKAKPSQYGMEIYYNRAH